MVSAIQAFSSLQVSPASRLRGGTSQLQSEELAKALRQKESATSTAQYTVNIPQSSALLYATQNPEVAAETVVGERNRRSVRGDAAEAKGQSTNTQATGIFSFSLTTITERNATLASVQPVQAQLDSASFVSLYSSNDAFPVLSRAERNAQPFALASQALAQSFSFGEELALNVAA